MLAITLKAFHCLAFEFDKLNIVLRVVLLCALQKLTHTTVLLSVNPCFGCLLCLEVARVGG